MQIKNNMEKEGMYMIFWFIGMCVFVGIAYFVTQYNRQEDENEKKITYHGNGTPAQLWMVVKILVFIICLISFVSQCDNRSERHLKSVKKVQDSYNRYYR